MVSLIVITSLNAFGPLDSRNASITGHCMHSANSHSIQLLFVSYSVYFDVSDQTLVWAAWNQFALCLANLYPNFNASFLS